MTSELRNAVALWSDPSPPNDFCHYDHCSAKALFGTMRIEWKSWKDYPGYCLYFDAGETFIGSFDSLDQAKSHAAAIIEQDREAVRAEVVGEIVALLDGNIKFHLSAVEAGDKAGADMPAVSGGVAALRMLQRQVEAKFGKANVAD